MKINEMTIRIYKDPILDYANRLQISYNNGSHIIMDDPDSSTLDDRLWCLKVDDSNGKNRNNKVKNRARRAKRHGPGTTIPAL